MSDQFNPLYGIEQELQKRRLAQTMAQSQDSTTTGIPWSNVAGSTAAQGQQQDPLSQYQRQTASDQAADRQRMMQAVSEQPSQQGLQQAAAGYQNVGPEPRPQDYKTSVLRKLVFAPFEFKSIVRDPQRGLANLDYLSKPGYATDERDYQQRYAQAKQRFEIESQVLNESNRAWTEKIAGIRDIAGLNQAAATQNRENLLIPGQLQEQALRIQHANWQAQQDKMPVAADLLLGHLPGGKTETVRRMVFPDSHMEYWNTDNKPVKVDFVSPVPPERIPAENEELLNKYIQRDNPQHPEWTTRTAPPAVVIEAQKKMDDEKGRLAEDRQVQREKAQQTRLEQTQAHSDLRAYQNEVLKPIDELQKNTIAQIGTIREGMKALELGGINAVAGNLARLSIVKGALKGSGARMTNMEVNLANGGKWQELGGMLRRWSLDPKTAGSATPEVLRQMKEYQQALMNEAERISKLNTEYTGYIRGTKRQEDIPGFLDKYQQWLEDPEGTEIKALEDELKRRGK